MLHLYVPVCSREKRQACPGDSEVTSGSLLPRLSPRETNTLLLAFRIALQDASHSPTHRVHDTVCHSVCVDNVCECGCVCVQVLVSHRGDVTNARE